MPRVAFLFLFAVSLVHVCGPTLVEADERPNVVVILSDDQGWGDLSFNGNTDLSTPNIDSLANDGAHFEHFYVCPVCSPTRAEFLTGRYHPRASVYSTSTGGERIDLDEVTIGDTFQAAGYKTAAFGKWHSGMQFPYHPNARGFGEYYGFCSGHWGHYFSPMLEHNNEITHGDGFIIDDLTNHAIDFIKEHHDEPFFVYLPYNTPHAPMQVPDRWWNKFKDKELKLQNRDKKLGDIGHTRAALAMCENIDWNVGRLLKTLEDQKLAENTIVIYFCDNGPNGWRWNADMKGRKGSTDEGGVRSPMHIRWPKQIPKGRTIEQIGGVIDLLPTLTEFCGIDSTSKKPLDGISLADVITGKTEKTKQRVILSHWNKKVSARTQRFRLDTRGQLFDMQADPGQREDISKDHPNITKRLKAQVARYREEVMKDYNVGGRPFTLGHKDSKNTQIPARDGTGHGNILRSNRHPNCTYFHTWTSVDDSITWDVEVLEPGTYEVDLYYACPESDLGSTIVLQCGESSVVAKVTKANDPPLVGAEHDRVPRPESYVKDFRPMSIGPIQLKAGKQTLTLKAKKIPGKQAMEFRLLMFRRVTE